MRITVLGAGGMLGRDLCSLLRQEHQVTALPRAEADVTNLSTLQAQLGECQPEVVINCAAATDVDRCEAEPDWAFLVNGWGAWAAAAAAEQSGARLIQISTDFVFSGESARPYTEWDATGPVNVYGASKLAGEAAVLRACRRVSVVRTQWLYGAGSRSFPRSILAAARRQPAEELPVVEDQWGAPTYTRHLARKLRWLVEWPADGFYHINNAGECSRWEWAKELLQLAGISGVTVTPIRSENWAALAGGSGRVIARRPARSTLRRFALELIGEDDLPPWQEGLREFVQELREAGELQRK